MKRIINHHTGGAGRASAEDLRAYHMLTEWDGTIVKGTEEIADNVVTSDGDYAAHTRNLNTGSIGLAMCGMRGAIEHPFDPGPSPINEKQFEAHCILVAEMCRMYSIPVTRQTVLTHAEVEPTLGVPQRGKWDITRLVFKPDIVGAIPVGDYLRERVRHYLGDHPVSDFEHLAILRMGNTNPREEVRILQRNLVDAGYLVGKIDGLFGRRTRSAVLSFQADNELVVDGIVGPSTWAAFDKTEPVPEREITERDLKERGSRTIDLTQKGEKALNLTEGTLGTGITIGGAIEMAAAAQRAEGALETATRIIQQHWFTLLVILGVVVATRYGKKILKGIKDERIRKARTGEDLRL